MLKRLTPAQHRGIDRLAWERADFAAGSSSEERAAAYERERQRLYAGHWPPLQTAWIDPQSTGGSDMNTYADPPFRYCPPDGCADPVACGQAMSCGCCDASDRSEAVRNGTFHELPICVIHQPAQR